MFSHSARRQGLLTELAAVAAAIIAAVAVWLIARYGFDLRLRTPGFGPAAHPKSLGIALVIVAGAVASAAGWLLARLARRTASPRRTWVTASLVVLAVSLAAPLAGHGIDAAARLALVCMHLAIGAVLIPVFAATMDADRADRAGKPARSGARQRTASRVAS